MAYTATYAASDLDDIIIDIIGSIGVQYATFAAIIVIVAIAGMLMAKLRGWF